MSNTIKLFNTGKRKIEYRTGIFFKPGTCIEFPIEEGNKIRNLFVGEVKTAEDFEDEYVPEIAGAKSAEEIKKAGRPPKEK